MMRNMGFKCSILVYLPEPYLGDNSPRASSVKGAPSAFPNTLPSTLQYNNCIPPEPQQRNKVLLLKLVFLCFLLFISQNVIEELPSLVKSKVIKWQQITPQWPPTWYDPDNYYLKDDSKLAILKSRQ